MKEAESMMKRFNMFALVVLLSAATMGCTATQKWMAGGAVAGATVGGIWAHNSSSELSDVHGALIGGATGAAAGGLIGSLVDAKYIRDLEAKNKELMDRNAQLEKELADARAEIARLQAEIDRLKNGQMRVTILDDQLFRSGSATLSAEGKKALADVAGRIKSQYPDSYVVVQGHTDTQPIKLSKWRDNWQLGSERALTVMRELIKQGVNAQRCSAETYGETRPVVPNTTPENMAQNRRAEIVVRAMDMSAKGKAEMSAAPAARSDRPAGARQGRGRGRGARGGAAAPAAPAQQ